MILPGLDGQIVNRASDCEYHKYERRFTEQFINGLDDKVMIAVILKEITA